MAKWCQSHSMKMIWMCSRKLWKCCEHSRTYVHEKFETFMIQQYDTAEFSLSHYIYELFECIHRSLTEFKSDMNLSGKNKLKYKYTEQEIDR